MFIPGYGVVPDQIDILEVIGSGVEVDDDQSSNAGVARAAPEGAEMDAEQGGEYYLFSLSFFLSLSLPSLLFYHVCLLSFSSHNLFVLSIHHYGIHKFCAVLISLVVTANSRLC